MYGLQSNAVLSDANDDDAAGLVLASLVDLVGECDADLGHGAGRRAAHQALLFRVDDNRLVAFVRGGGDCEAVGGALVGRQLRLDLGLFPGAAHVAQEHEGADEEGAQQDEQQQGDEKRNVGAAEAVLFAAGRELLDVHHEVGGSRKGVLRRAAYSEFGVSGR